MQVHHPIVVGILVGIAVLLAILSSIGVMVMRNALQRLHFSAIVVTFSSLLIVAAVWVEEKDPQPRIKVILIGIILYVMNSVLASATGKAARIHDKGHWEPHPEEQIPVIGRDYVAGEYGATEDHKA